MRATLRWLWIPFVAAIVVAVDQWTKSLVIANLPMNGSYTPFPALERYFNIVHWSNTGAAFGLLRGNSSLFVIIALAVVVAVMVYARHLPLDSWLVRTCLGLQLGGAIGNNLIDRLRLGHVTDFLLFTLPVGDKVYAWPAWNVADGSIVVGVILLALVLLREEGKAVASETVAAAGSESQ